MMTTKITTTILSSLLFVLMTMFMTMTTILVQPVSSLAFEFTGTEEELGFMFDDDIDDNEGIIRGGGEKKCRSISK